MSENPFAAPAAPLAKTGDDISEDERLRRAHLSHEASLRGIGSLMLLGILTAVFAVPAFFLAVYAAFTDAGASLGFRIGYPIAIFAIGAIAFNGAYAGYLLRKLDPRAKGFATAQSGFMLFAFPMGTLLGIYSLYLIHSKRGLFILTEEYQGIRARTPHIKYRTSPLVLILLGLLIALVLAGVVFSSIRL